ncbi:MAG TPA: MMPL family transporter [Usitatibacter sp.]|nr:MMPL family transporter [Usitatibacter sp.]
MPARRIAIGLWAAGLALCALVVSQARFVADLSSFFPDAPTEEQKLLVDQLRDGAISRVMLMGIEGGDAAARAALSRALAARLAADTRFSTVSNGAAGAFERERDLLLAYRYVLSPRVDAARFEVAGLRAAISETLDLLASPAGMAVKALVPRDPTGELLATAERLRPAEGPPTVEGVWASPDGTRALLVARTRAAGADIDAQADALAGLRQHFAEVAAGRDAKLLVTGPGVFSAQARAMIERDVERLALVSLAIVASLLLAVYRSPLALALGLVPVLSGALAGFAAVSLGFGVVHGITVGFGTTLIGEAVDYSIYLFVQSERSADAGEGWVAGFWPTVRLGVLTSISGFAALVFSGLPGLAQLGVYSVTGLVVAAAVTRFVLPQLLPAGFRIRDVTPLGLRLGRVCAFLARGRWLVAAVALTAGVVLALHHATLWDPQISTLNPIPERDRRIDLELRGAIGASDTRHTIAVRAPSADEALASAEKVGRELDRLVTAGQLGGYESPARALPSAATQRARLDALPDAATLRARLKEALQGMPLRPERLEPFVADVEKARATGALTRERFTGSVFEAALDGHLFRDASGRWIALLGLRSPEGARVDPAVVARAIASAGAAGALSFDMKAEIDRLYSGYFDRALTMSALGLAAIVALLAAALRSPARVLRVLAPLLAGVLVVAAWHALSGTRMSLLHLVGLLLVVAIGSNYALFFDRMAAGGAVSAPRTLASLALANFTTVASFGALALSGIPLLRAIGSTVALGAFATLVFAAMLAGRGIQFPPVHESHADDHRQRG